VKASTNKDTSTRHEQQKLTTHQNLRSLSGWAAATSQIEEAADF
jgi:hypothetical protein